MLNECASFCSFSKATVSIVAVAPINNKSIKLECFSKHIRGLLNGTHQTSMTTTAKLIYVEPITACQWSTMLIQCEVENDMSYFAIRNKNGLPVSVRVIITIIAAYRIIHFSKSKSQFGAKKLHTRSRSRPPAF
jgi:hypothetical protein